MPNSETSWVLGLTLLALSGTLAVFQVSDLDRLVQAHFYDADTARWIWDRHEAWGKAVLYDSARIAVGLYAVGLIFALVVGHRRGWSAFVRKGLWIALLTVVLLPSLVGGLKKFTNLACPRATADYGGEVPFIHLFDSRPSETNVNHQCFPAGHASGGFALLALPLLSRSPRRRRLLLAGALAFGWIIGIYKMLIGDHFLSHTLVTMLLAWLVVYSLKYAADRWFPADDGSPVDRLPTRPIG